MKIVKSVIGSIVAVALTILGVYMLVNFTSILRWGGLVLLIIAIFLAITSAISIVEWFTTRHGRRVRPVATPAEPVVTPASAPAEPLIAPDPGTIKNFRDYENAAGYGEDLLIDLEKKAQAVKKYLVDLDRVKEERAALSASARRRLDV